MKIFCLDTTRKRAVIQICNDEHVNYTIAMDENVKHSEGLFLYIEKALFECKLEIKDFDYLACVVGPGSFTGIRVGMATIKGFNKVINKKIIPINTFEVLKKHVHNGVILLNSTNSSCYYAIIKSKEIAEAGVVNKEEIVNKFEKSNIFVLKEEQGLIGLEYNNIRVVEDLSTFYLDAIKEKIDQDEEFEFVPYYLQLSQAERNLKNE